jgi:hypothetical protein
MFSARELSCPAKAEAKRGGSIRAQPRKAALGMVAQRRSIIQETRPGCIYGLKREPPQIGTDKVNDYIEVDPHQYA